MTGQRSDVKTAIVIGAALSGVALAMLSLFPDIPAWSAAIATVLTGVLGFGVFLAAERMTGQKSDGKTAVIIGASLSGLTLVGGIISFSPSYLRGPHPALFAAGFGIMMIGGLGFGVGGMLTGGHSTTVAGMLAVGTAANLALFSALALTLLKLRRRLAGRTSRARAAEP